MNIRIRCGWAMMLALLGCASLGSALALAQPPSLRFQGVINEQSVLALEDRLKDAPRGTTLVFASPGGDARQALRLGDFLFNHDIRLELSGYCLSACLSELVPSVGQVTVQPGTVFLLHHSLSSIYLLAHKNHPQLAERRYGESARSEQALYRKRGLPLSLLYLPLAKMGPECGFVVNDRQGKPMDFFARTRFSAYAPNPQLLRAFGLNISGDDWQTPEAIKHRLDSLMPKAILVTSAGPRDSQRTLDALKSELDLVPDCKKEQEIEIDPDGLFK